MFLAFYKTAKQVQVLGKYKILLGQEAFHIHLQVW